MGITLQPGEAVIFMFDDPQAMYRQIHNEWASIWNAWPHWRRTAHRLLDDLGWAWERFWR